ncbi:isochorismatase-like protein [Aureococcus anophagefferens]|nr:isochorismatase-like protein [Aureococcus anophagefferens]
MNHAKAPVEFGFDEPAPFARVPGMRLSDEPWRDSPWDIGAVEHGEQPAVIGGGLSSADGMLCIEVGVERSRPRADSGGRPPRARGASPASERLAGLDKRRVAKSYAPAAGWRGRRLLAVCGRDREAWLDYAGDAESVTRIFVGWAVARGAKLYVDGDDGVCVASGDQDDATVFGVYVVDERALLAATLARRGCAASRRTRRFDLADVAGVARVPTTPRPTDLVEARHKIAARPFAFPLGGDALDPATTALLVIDLQRLLRRGRLHAPWVAARRLSACSPETNPPLGYDVAPLREPLPKVQAVLRACRAKSIRCFHTRQGYRPDLADLSAYARRKFKRAGVTVGAAGPLGRLFVRGEPGSEIVEAARPREGEPVIDKTANDAFIGTDLDRLLRCAGVRHLVVVGNTLDCCVHSTLRHANDLGLFQRRATGVFFRVNFA